MSIYIIKSNPCSFTSFDSYGTVLSVIQAANRKALIDPREGRLVDGQFQKAISILYSHDKDVFMIQSTDDVQNLRVYLKSTNNKSCTKVLNKIARNIRIEEYNK